jgi:small-conductance mechanosensitive channel
LLATNGLLSDQVALINRIVGSAKIPLGGDQMNTRLWASIWRVSIVLLLGFGFTLLLQMGLRGIEHKLVGTGERDDRKIRLMTLVHAGRSIGRVIILFLVLLMILHELGLNIMPVLASAGVVGLAFSLGTQTIIRDFLGGIIILLENQFSIGDIISIGQITGTVERITLRATYLRGSEGILTTIPNGDVRTLSNLTSHWAQVLVTLNLDYEADMGLVLRTLEKSFHQVQSDKDIASAMLEFPRAVGWTSFTDWSVQAQIIVKTQPGKQWSVARALRKAALENLNQEGLYLAIPRQRYENVR